MTKFIKLTELYLTVDKEVLEREIFINPHRIKYFEGIYTPNFRTYLTAIHWAPGGFNNTYVKETPEQIIKLLAK